MDFNYNWLLVLKAFNRHIYLTSSNMYMYNLTWIIKSYNKNSRIYRYEFSAEDSDDIFNDFNPGSFESDSSFEELVDKINEITKNYLSSIDPYNKIIDHTNIHIKFQLI